jgi:thioesterase domain-containing protein
VEALGRLIAGSHSPTSDLEALLPLRPNGSKHPLFCIHHAGGLSWSYAKLIPHIPSSYPIYGLQPSNLQQCAALPESVDDVALEYLRLIRQTQPAGPYSLIGWSFGGLVAHAIATQLQSIGHEVAFLALLDSYPAGERALHRHDHEECDKSALFDRGADDLIRNMLGILRREVVALKEPHYEIIKDIFNNNKRLMTTFAPKRFCGDILLFVAADGEADPAVEAWRPYITGRIKIYRIDCTHEAMMDPAPAAQIGGVLASELDKHPAQRRSM